MRKFILMMSAVLLAIPSAASADTSKPVLSGLRGGSVAAAKCTGAVPVTGDDVRITGTLRSFTVCPSPAPVGGTKRAITATKYRHAALFAALRKALTAADGVAQPGQICPMYADVLRLVYVTTSRGVWLAHLPVDSCHHYTVAVKSALAKAV